MNKLNDSLKKSILLFALFINSLFTLSTDIHAQEYCTDASTEGYEFNIINYYFKIFAGANFLQSTSIDGNHTQYNTGYTVSGSLGISFCYGLRVEGEYAIRSNSINEIQFFQQGSSDHGNLQTSSYMGNFLWDLPLSSCGYDFWNIQPFLGFGLGYDYHEMDSSNSLIIFNQKWNHFSWQLMAGVAYPIFCNTEITLEYRYHQGGPHFFHHSVGIGLMYKLNL